MVTAVLRKQQRSLFSTIHSEGTLFPLDMLQRIEQFDPTLEGTTAASYHREGYKLNEAINNAWLQLLPDWHNLQNELSKPHTADRVRELTLNRWLLRIFEVFGYGRLPANKQAIRLENKEKNYAITYGWGQVPFHLVSYQQELDEVLRTPGTTFRNSAYSLVQELLNNSNEHLWGIVSNGRTLRLLRRNVSLTRQAYVEFDLERMMQGEAYADFALFWLLCHYSRFEGERLADCWLEQWTKTAQENGVRALDTLRAGVEQAINALGKGFLTCNTPANYQLRTKLREGTLAPQDYYRQVLRLVYRLIILFVAEDREVLFHPDASPEAKQRYLSYYSTRRLRRLSEQRIGTRHTDQFRALWIVMEKLGAGEGYPELGLPALNGFLFSSEAVADLAGCGLTNYALLDAIRSLSTIDDKGIYRSVDYKNLGSEELGSVYESLLELHPDLTIGENGVANFKLKHVSGNERKTSGSYYTPTSLIDCLLDSALNPVLEEACQGKNEEEAEQAILNLKVCDPACGSGHFLIAAAHRIAKKLAAIRTGDEEPAPDERRKALRMVVGSCIYGVDINPMSVELCKVNLWMETIDPGKPLSFLDSHILCGNSLLGTTPYLMDQGIPDSAFEPIEGDKKKVCSDWKKLNKKYREGNQTLFNLEGQPWEDQRVIEAGMNQIDLLADDTVKEVHRKYETHQQLLASQVYQDSLLRANAWCAAFVWKKTEASLEPITQDVYHRLSRNSQQLTQPIQNEIERLAQQYQFFHWHLAFPTVFRVFSDGQTAENVQTGWSGGFDVVLGNPPWEKIKIQEKEWFAARRPDIANAANTAQRRKMIVALEHEDADLHAAFRDDLRKAEGESYLIRHSERYPLCGRGDVNTYTIFAEGMRHIIGSTGRMGCIVPSGIATDDTTKFFFQNLMASQTLVSLYSFENEEFIFPAIHHATKFCLLTISGDKRKHATADFVFFARQTSYLQDEERHFSLSAADVALLNPNTHTCPIFRSKRDMLITKTIYEQVPILVKEGISEENPWNISFNRMFDMSNDSHLFHMYDELQAQGWHLRGNIFYRGNETCLPLYEGKMIWLYDHRFGTYDGQTEAQANQGKLPELDASQHNDPNLFPMPRYWVHEHDLPEIMRQRNKAFLAFRDVTSAVVLRTAIFSIIPTVPCGHTLPIMIPGNLHSQALTYLASYNTSFVFDYVTRQKLGGTHMTFFILKQLPVLLPQLFETPCQWANKRSLGSWIFLRALELTYTAWDLEAFAKDCGYDGPPFHSDEERRFLLRCELDAAYFHLYGITRDDVAYIMETFLIVKRKDEKEYGKDNYRTKQVILEIYDKMQQAMESGEAYETLLVPGPADPAVAHPARVVEAWEGLQAGS
ncbi:N-6 DNA methylase [Ktedonobacteria bacterium brp13]|nr:N-6 DNA methylase [Ktedonobacteria bacterium brp13]